MMKHKNATVTEAETRLMAALCRYIEQHSDAALPLAELAAQAHLSPTHLQRRFKAVVGLSPRQYQEAFRLKTLKKNLKGKVGVTGAIYDAGFGSSSRVYGQVNSRLGMTPGQYRRHGAGLDIYYATAKTPVGLLLMAATERGICAVELGDDAAMLVDGLQSEFPAATLHKGAKGTGAELKQWMAALNEYLQGRSALPKLPLDIQGTAFQAQVWRYLQTIPMGKTRSYTDVAKAVGKPDAVRAVATACARNKIALLIPCHRVISSSGKLAGYRWSLPRKKQLLELEGAI
ncbi:MAG: methylated-DNA--[protein]-cysteine S-methyltransferase [Micavibrio sp.]|nr:methylated-DNA--[protein]-cysteine S-methyltransferase [Micavibrio sp.]